MFQIVRKTNIGNRTFKCRERTEVCIGEGIIPWIYYMLAENYHRRQCLRQFECEPSSMRVSVEYKKSFTSKQTRPKMIL